MSSILELAKQLNKEFKSDSFARVSDVIPNYKRLHSKALGMDYPLFGGLPYGRICVYSGKQHSGKTTAAFAEIAAYQAENPDKYCVFVDVEHAVDLQFQVAMHGIDQQHLLVVSPDVGMSGEQVLGVVLNMQLTSDDIGMIVIDSIAALDTAQNLQNDFEKDNGKRATIAGPLHKFCKEIVSSLENKQNILIFINQVRVAGTTFTGAPIYTEPGGDGPKFYSSVSVRFGTRSFVRGDEELKGENGGEGADGFRIKFQITKNKTAPCNRGGGFITYRYATGMDWMHDLLEIAITFDFIKRLTSKSYALVDLETGEVLKDADGNELKGYKKDLIDYIMNHEEFRENYIKMLNNYISSENTQKVNILDKDTVDEIKAEEGSIKE